MKKNLGTADRALRLVLVIVIGILYLTGVVSGTLAIILGVVAIMLVLTSLISFCPAYVPFHFSTLKRSTEAS